MEALVLGECLRAGRERKGWSQEQAAYRLGVSQPYWRWSAGAAKLNDLQNRLGFVTVVARRVAESMGEDDKAALLARQESLLERSRLAREDTLCHDSLTEAERRWLRRHRTPEARHWNLLTDLSHKHLNYDA